MHSAPSDQDGPSSDRKSLYVEDVLIMLSLIPLFVLGVFYRDRTWAQAALGGVLVVMVVVFIIRLRRVHRSFMGRRD